MVVREKIAADSFFTVRSLNVLAQLFVIVYSDSSGTDCQAGVIGRLGLPSFEDSRATAFSD